MVHECRAAAPALAQGELALEHLKVRGQSWTIRSSLVFVRSLSRAIRRAFVIAIVPFTRSQSDTNNAICSEGRSPEPVLSHPQAITGMAVVWRPSSLLHSVAA
jgi:hypothetical protein